MDELGQDGLFARRALAEEGERTARIMVWFWRRSSLTTLEPTKPVAPVTRVTGMLGDVWSLSLIASSAARARESTQGDVVVGDGSLRKRGYREDEIW